MKIKFFVIALLTIIPFVGDAASFNCSRASTAIEESICYNHTLNRLDTEMGRLYREALYSIADIRSRQREWINRRNRRCGANEECLIRMTRKRNEILRREIDEYQEDSYYQPKPRIRKNVFSPQQGIICDRKSSFCADSYGISIAYTKRYLGNRAAKRLQRRIERDRMDTKSYTLSNGIYCNSRRYRCYQSRYSDAQPNRKYTNILFR